MPMNAFNFGENVASEGRENYRLGKKYRLLEPKEKVVICIAMCNISNELFFLPLSLQNGSHCLARCDFLCTIDA